LLLRIFLRGCPADKFAPSAEARELSLAPLEYLTAFETPGLPESWRFESGCPSFNN
jgi:hypothetical protein